MDSDQARVREAIQDRADDGEEPADRLARLRGAVTRIGHEPALISAARRFRRRLPGDERVGDPLSTAGRAPVEVIARGVTALQPGRASVAKELSLSALHVWQSLSQAAGRGRGDLEMALLFTDLVGFSSWALAAGDIAVLELLREVGSAVEHVITSPLGSTRSLGEPRVDAARRSPAVAYFLAVSLQRG
ncbi:MAG TPA: hypothetical protein VMJ65_08590 [Solirubrobacteraceae bacterium]|nr:hypothetical protein [Solirubrobacteraceae bacterium]